METSEESQIKLLDFVDLRSKFKELTGRHLSQRMEITEGGVFQTYRKMVDLEERLRLGKTQTGDLPLATSFADKILNWFLAKRREGAVPLTKAPKEVNKILEELRQVTDPEKRKDLIAKQYLADPKLGANKAVEILEELKSSSPQDSS